MRRRWLIIGTVALATAFLSRCEAVRGIVESTRSPAEPFARTQAPPAPDYQATGAWFAFPGRGGLERSTPPGMTPVVEATAPADVFYIHPTTYLKNDAWNTAYDKPGPYDAPVLLGQLSAFNGCCRLYAPRYRQASLRGLRDAAAVALAYSDVERAFRRYVAHHNRGRPFIIASHSQGTGHAVRLLQDVVMRTPLRNRLIAAYTVGAFTPETFADIGLPTCATPEQLGCIVSWNTSEAGRTGASILTRDVDYHWAGARRRSGAVRAICVNPLTWSPGGAPRSANAGSLPFPRAPFPTAATTLPPLVPRMVGAVCDDRLLAVELPWSAPSGFRDALSVLYGSYHKNDYGLFYANVRANAVARVAAWRRARR